MTPKMAPITVQNSLKHLLWRIHFGPKKKRRANDPKPQNPKTPKPHCNYFHKKVNGFLNIIIKKVSYGKPYYSTFSKC